MKKSIIMVYICGLLNCFVFLYFHRPMIPFELISPSFTWRSYETKQKYRQNNKTQFIINLKERLKNKDYVFLENDYPYNVDAKHYVLWVKNENFNIPKLIEERFSGNKTKYFENYGFLKSIPEIKHYQVFVKTFQ